MIKRTSGNHNQFKNAHKCTVITESKKCQQIVNFYCLILLNFQLHTDGYTVNLSSMVDVHSKDVT
jgi:hypothetical protein